jgi:GDSL-like Lipase/Acylhydrolase family
MPLSFARIGRRLIRGLLSFFVVMAIFFLLLEVAGRMVDPLGISYYPETARYLDTMIIEEPIGYRNRPYLQGRFWGQQLSINSLGLRDREVDTRSATAEFRILLLGDSVVFGLGVADDETIPQQLEHQLNHLAEIGIAEDNTIYLVLNMGVPSYNTEQQLIQLETLGLALDPDVVALMFSSNDLQPKMWVFARRQSPVVNLPQRSYASSVLAVLYWELRRLLAGNDPRAPFEVNQEEHPRWSVVESALTRIAAVCESRGIPFVLFVRGSYPRLEALADETAMKLVDLSALRQSDPRWKEPGTQLEVSRINHHPNRLGSEVYSTLIRESLQRLARGSRGTADHRRSGSRSQGPRIAVKTAYIGGAEVAFAGVFPKWAGGFESFFACCRGGRGAGAA